MVTITVQEAQADLAEALRRVKMGEDVLIAENGKPVARLTRPTEAPARVPGTGRGKIAIAPDFDAPLPEEVLDSFER